MNPTQSTVNISAVLCPVDFSYYSERATRYAHLLGRQFGARVCILHIAEEPTFAPPGARAELSTALTESRRNALQQQLDVYGNLRSDGDVAVNTSLLVVTQKTVVQAIVDAAHELSASIIVMGTHGHSGLKRLMFGSTTEGVLRHSQVPVLAIPPTFE